MNDDNYDNGYWNLTTPGRNDGYTATYHDETGRALFGLWALEWGALLSKLALYTPDGFYTGTRTPQTHSYRLTSDEYVRYLRERDTGLDSPATALRYVRDAAGHWITDGTHASAAYDNGFYWIRTGRKIDWM